MKQYKSKVLEIHEETPGVFIIKLERPKHFEFKAGQFIMVTRTINGKPFIRPYSISSPPSQTEYLELCVKRVEGGKVSPYLCSLKKGQTLEFKGPAGNLCLVEKVNNGIYFAATGTGISPTKSLIDTLFERGCEKDVYLFYGVRTHKDIIYREHFEKLAKKHKNFHFIPVLSREHWKGEEGHVQDPIRNYVGNAENKDMHIYICGVPVMVKETLELAKSLGFKEENIHYERC